MGESITRVVGWILGALVSIGTFGQALSVALPCERLPFTYQTQSACKILEHMNLRPNYRVASFR